MRKIIPSATALLFALFAPRASFAQLANYGYVVGSYVPGSAYVEPLSQQGQFLHYHFKVQIEAGTQYEIVMDIKNGHIHEYPYRIIPLRPANASYYGPIFSATRAFHSITMTATGGTASQGALDYIRHQGILRDLAGQPWSYRYVQGTSDPDIFTIPEWDQLFTGSTKIIVFGEKYSTGYGMHVVHQNQGDKNPNFFSDNGTFQDGAVIFEYAPNSQGAVRKMLMTRFEDQPAYNGVAASLGQSDFSYTTDPDGPGGVHVGQYAPFTTASYSYSSGSPGVPQRYGPFFAEQFQVYNGNGQTDGEDCVGYYDVDIFVGSSPTVSDTNYEQYSRFNGCGTEFVRSYSATKKNFYVYVKPWWVPSNTPITVKYR